MSNVAEPASGAIYKILRELGARYQPSYAAVREPRELVVLHRFAIAGRTRGAGVVELADEAALATVIAEADAVARNWHPNVARVRNVDVYGGDQAAVATELVDGGTLEDLVGIANARTTGRLSDALPLPVVVRVLLDVLAGLHALHTLRDPQNRKLGMAHGAIAPANVVVGRDGVARLVNVLRPRGRKVTPASEALGYAAPEVLEGDPADARSDVYSVGVMLWEALAGRRLWPETSPERVRARQRAEEIPTPPDVTTFGLEHLPAVALRALSFDPARRFRSATDMASELRKPRDAQIASGAVVASAVATLDGDRIRGRRARLDPSSSGARPRPTDAQIEEHLAALDEASPATVSYDGSVRATPPGGMPSSPPAAVDDSAWDDEPTMEPQPAPPPPPKRPAVPLPSASSSAKLAAAKLAVPMGTLSKKPPVPKAPGPKAANVPVPGIEALPEPVVVAPKPEPAITAPKQDLAETLRTDPPAPAKQDLASTVRVEDRLSALPTRPAAFSVHMPESEGMIPTAGYAPAFPAVVEAPVRPSSTSSVVTDEEPEPEVVPPPPRRRSGAIVAALLLLLLVGVGARALLAPEPRPMAFTALPPPAPTPEPVPLPVVVPEPAASVAPPPPVETAAPVEPGTGTGTGTAPPAPLAKPKRYEPLGI